MAELSLKGSKGSVLTVEQTSSKRKSFGKKKSAKKQKVDGKKKKTKPKKKAADKKKYFYYQSDSHWKRNYPQCLATLKNKDRKSTRLNSSHSGESRMPSSA